MNPVKWLTDEAYRKLPLSERALIWASTQVGVEEHPRGSNRGTEVEQYQHSSGSGPGEPWCFTGDVQVLTNRGFVRWDALTDELIGQVDPVTRKVSFVKPIRLIVKDYSGPLFSMDTGNGGVVTCDKGHQWWGDWKVTARSGIKLTDKFEKRPLGDLLTVASRLFIPNQCGGTSRGVGWDTRNLKLLGYFMADGCFHRGKMAFQVSKPEKVAALTGLGPASVYVAPNAYGPRSKKALTAVEFHCPSEIGEILGDKKSIDPSFVCSLSPGEARILLDAFCEFDGCRKNGSTVLGQASLARIETAYLLAVIAGYSPTRTKDRVTGEFGSKMYGIRFADPKNKMVTKSDLTVRLADSEKLYCAEVPSGLLLVRGEYGRPVITGNCASFVTWCLLKAGATRSQLPDNPAAVASWAHWAKSVKCFSHVPGRAKLFYFLHPNGTGHIGWCTDGAISFGTIEGNSNDEGSREGYEVCRRKRSSGGVTGFIDLSKLVAP